jgi:pSer/pThr/pTyr-binding forkhead associated (FHA) protein
MAYLQLNDRQIPLRAGDTTIGGATTSDVRVDGLSESGPTAVVNATGAGTVIRLALAESAVRVNGVALGVEPVPLIHGDRIEVGGSTLIFGDAAKGGSTAFFSGANVAELLKQREGAAPSAVRQPTANTGGRLVSLTDGREYPIISKPFTIGRDPACDVVIASGEVSRSHAEIEVGAEGYYLIDTSTNGVLVNGSRVDGTITLARGDVIRLGPEEFRFYADKASATAPAPAAAAAAPAPVPAAAPAPAPAPSVEPAAPAPAKAPPAAPARPVLARLELQLSAGAKVVELTEPLTQLGRGQHNDVVVTEESVSDSHAKIQRRGDGWYLVDMGSTNGSFVGGVRVQGEAALGTSVEIKLGALRGSFAVAGAPAAGAAGKGETAVLSGALAAQLAAARQAAAAPSPAPAGPPASAPTPKPAAPPAPKAASGGLPSWVWVAAVLAAAAGGAYFYLAGR